MAWDDTPPAPHEVSKIASWDSTPPNEEELKPPPNILESGIHGIVNNIPLGPQIASGVDALLGTGHKGNYSENLADYNQKFSEAKKEHPVAYGAGAVTGALAPLAIPGVGEALSASPIMGNAALGAANAISNTDLMNKPTQALKEAGVGALIGGTVGGVMNKLMPSKTGLENFAKTKGLQSTGIETKQLGEMAPEELQAAKDFVTEHGLIGTDKEAILKKALGTQKQIGESIGNIGSELDKAGVKASEDEILGAVQRLQDKAAETAGLENPELRKLAIWHNKGANDILNKIGDDPSWQSIQKLKEAYGTAAFKSTGEVKNEAAKNIYFTLKDMLKNLTQKASDNPNLPNEYKTALASYHTIDPIIEGLQKEVGQLRGGFSGHGGGHGFIPKLIRSLPGQNNPAINLATAAAATAFSPHLGPIMALPTLTNPAVQSRAASAIANKLPGIGQGMTQEVLDYLQSKYGK